MKGFIIQTKNGSGKWKPYVDQGESDRITLYLLEGSAEDDVADIVDNMTFSEEEGNLQLVFRVKKYELK